MIDLSNNNSKGHNFITAYQQGGQRRLYLKRVQGVHFIDQTFPDLRLRALKAGFQVGEYDFLEPLVATPREAADFLLKDTVHPLIPGRDERPALDVEWGQPSARMGVWVTEMANLVATHLDGIRPLIYGSPSFLEACAFQKAPGPLWMASYGRNDGRFHPVTQIPHPWTHVAAYQYSSKAHVLGIDGPCDESRIYHPLDIDLPAGHKPLLAPVHKPVAHKPAKPGHSGPTHGH